MQLKWRNVPVTQLLYPIAPVKLKIQQLLISLLLQTPVKLKQVLHLVPIVLQNITNCFVLKTNWLKQHNTLVKTHSTI